MVASSTDAGQVKEDQRHTEIQCPKVEELIKKFVRADVKEVPKMLSQVLHLITIAAEEDKTNHGNIVWTKELHETELTREQFLRLVSQVHQQHCQSDVAMAMLGLKCMEEEEPEMAEVCLQSAVRANPESLMATENLRVLRECMIHRWHFRMLNDLQRNSAYAKAIGVAVEGLVEAVPLVLDIGCGTGLLRY